MGCSGAHLFFERKRHAQVGAANGFPDPQVPCHDTWSPKRSRQEPLRRPASNTTQRGKALNHLLVWQGRKSGKREIAARDRLRHSNSLFCLTRGKLQRADVCRSRRGKPLGIQAVDNLVVKRVPIAKCFG
jgi:hypothetical protein